MNKLQSIDVGSSILSRVLVHFLSCAESPIEHNAMMSCVIDRESLHARTQTIQSVKVRGGSTWCTYPFSLSWASCDCSHHNTAQFRRTARQPIYSLAQKKIIWLSLPVSHGYRPLFRLRSLCSQHGTEYVLDLWFSFAFDVVVAVPRLEFRCVYHVMRYNACIKSRSPSIVCSDSLIRYKVLEMGYIVEAMALEVVATSCEQHSSACVCACFRLMVPAPHMRLHTMMQAQPVHQK